MPRTTLIIRTEAGQDQTLAGDIQDITLTAVLWRLLLVALPVSLLGLAAAVALTMERL